MLKNKFKKSIVLGAVAALALSMNTINMFAYYSENSVAMYDGRLIAAIDVDPGDWGSRAEYTGYNPLGLPRLLLQTQIEGQDRVIRMFSDEATPSSNGNIYVIRTGGSNSAGNTGNNYARAIGYAWEGGDRRVATAYQ